MSLDKGDGPAASRATTIKTSTAVGQDREGKRAGGPRTTRGKAISARNSTRHGVLSKNPTALGESQEEWLAFLSGNRNHFAPEGTYEEEVVDAISVDWWCLRQVRRAMTSATSARYQAQEALDDDEGLLLKAARLELPPQADMDNLLRYQTTFERAIERKLRMLETSQRGRSGDLPAPLRLELLNEG